MKKWKKNNCQIYTEENVNQYDNVLESCQMRSETESVVEIKEIFERKSYNQYIVEVCHNFQHLVFNGDQSSFRSSLQIVKINSLPVKMD